MGLARFVAAQASVYPAALAELRAGRKRGHWMWFIFPQLAGLGRSSTARFYAIADIAEARDYLAHPILGPRLEECAQALLGHRGRRPETVLGPVDAVKLRSSMTLFEAAGGPAACAEVIDAFYDRVRCPLTLDILAR